MKTILACILACVLSLGLVTCRKNQLGGKGTLKGRVMHHTLPIAGAYIYIKYNATEFPGDDYSLYNTYIKSDSEGNYEVPNFYKGNYYLYCKGYDYTIASPYLVKGGLAITIRNGEHLNKDLAVTEGD